jgi:hypothetical protein
MNDDMDEDHLSRLRAIDAAVAVAAAAAAHQNSEAAAHRQQQQQHRLQESDRRSSLTNRQSIDATLQDLTENGVQGVVHNYPTTSPPAPSVAPDAREEAAIAMTKTEDQTHSFADTSMQYATEAQEHNGDGNANGDNGNTSEIEEKNVGVKNRPHVHHTKRRKINTCLPCKVSNLYCDSLSRACRLTDVPFPINGRDGKSSATARNLTVASARSTIFPHQSVPGALQ